MSLKLDLRNFDSFDYQNYIHQIGVNFLELKKDSLNNLSSTSIVLKKSDKTFAILTNRKWDSGILGVRTCSIDDIFLKKDVADDYKTVNDLIEMIIDYVNSNNIELLTFRFSSDKLKYLFLFERHGFIVADVLCTFLYNRLNSIIKGDGSDEIRIVSEEDYSSILNISKGNFRFSRLYLDKNISKNIADKFYLTLTKSMLKKKDNLKLVYEEKKKVCAFAIGTKAEDINRFFTKKFGYLSLIAVSKLYKGQRYGKKILNEFLLRFSKKIDYIETSTQINNPIAIRLYSSLGMLPVTHIITVHYWNKR